MEKLGKTSRTLYNGDSFMDGGYDESTVLLTRREAKLLKSRDEDTIDKLFTVADAMQYYYGGPGRAFIDTPGFHIEWRKDYNYYKPVAVITQRFGYDI